MSITNNATSILDWTPHSECTNFHISVDVLTPTVVETHCRRCGGKATALLEHYTKAEWQEITKSAQEHLDGKYSDPTTEKGAK